MGRYYSGDIEGKFWFGVQPSDDADFFGLSGYQPDYLCYSFEKENIPDVKKGIETCKNELGEWEQKFNDFFKKFSTYNDSTVEKYGLKPDIFNSKLEWYARLILGQKIYACLEKKGSCYFETEC